jgi:hypothetical protein
MSEMNYAVITSVLSCAHVRRTAAVASQHQAV